MEDTGKILGKYISKFLVYGILIGAITFFAEMTIINKYGLAYPSLVITLIIIIFLLTSFIVHMIAANKSIKNASLNVEKKVTLIKTVRVVLGIIALLVMIVDYVAFSNINKSYINDYRSTEIEKLKETVISGDHTQEELDRTQQSTEYKINSIIFIELAIKELTDILVYLAIAAYVEGKILRIKEAKGTKKKEEGKKETKESKETKKKEKKSKE